MRYEETERLVLRTVSEEDLPLLKEYLLKNREFLSPWEPSRDDSYYGDSSLLEMIANEKTGLEKQMQLNFYLFRKGEKSIIGNVNLTNIVKGVFLSCFLGYKLDESLLNKGYMTEAVGKTIEIAFGELGLHRIEANIMPRNISSIRVVEKLGFKREGISPKYLKINGVWEDHAHYVLLNEAVE